MTLTQSASDSLWFSVVGENILLVAHSKASPSDEGWMAVLDAIGTVLRRQKTLRAIVFTDGGAPNSSQRGELSKLSKDHELRIGVISDAASVRFVASSIALFTRSIRTFAPAQWLGACTHAGLSPAEIGLVRAALSEADRHAGGGHFATVKAALAAPTSK